MFKKAGSSKFTEEELEILFKVTASMLDWIGKKGLPLITMTRTDFLNLKSVSEKLLFIADGMLKVGPEEEKSKEDMH